MNVQETEPRQVFREGVSHSVRALSRKEQLILWIGVCAFLLSSIVLLLMWNWRFLVEVPAFGGTYTEGVIGFPRHINPVLARTDTDRDLVALVYAGLLRKASDGSFVPDLAERFEIAEDGKTYTVTLREGITWHDGEPITSEDVAFTIAAIQDDSREIKSVRRASWIGITVDVLDPRTIAFTLPTPYAPFLEQLTVGILPAHVWATLDPAQFDLSNFNTHPIGSGPYRVIHISEREDGIPEYYDLRAFRDYALGRPFIERIRLRFYGSETELIKAFERGDVMAISEIPPDLAAGIKDVQGKQVLSATLERIFAVYFNQSHNSTLQDKSVRQALEESIDREKLIEEVLFGYAVPVDGPIPPGRFAEAYVATTTAIDHLVAAQTILEEGKWVKGEDGIYGKKEKSATRKLAFSISTGDSPDLKRSAERLAAIWRALGADVEVRVFDKSTLTKDVIAARDYDVLLYGAVVDRLPDMLPFWHTSQRTDPGLNIALYANSKTDKLIEQARGAISFHEQKEALLAFTEELKTDIPAIFIYSPLFLYAENRPIGGQVLGTLSTRSDRFLDIQSWYLRTERVWPWFTADRPKIVSP